MQKCSKIEEYTPAKIDILKANLQLLHKYHLIHFDIKPENIVLCKKTGNPIFIDYGMSDFIKQTQGCKTYTYFRGCISFCLPEMI